MVVIGGGKHRLPVRAVGGLSEEYVASTTVLGNGEAAEVKPSTREVIESSSQQSIYTHILGSKTVTKVDGKRYLVNEGTEGGEFLLKSGQGLKGGGTQYIDTGVVPDMSKDFTLFWTQQRSGAIDQQNGSLNIVNGRFHFGITSSGVRVGMGNSAITLTDTLTNLNFYSVRVRYKASTGLAEIKNLTTGTVTGITVTEFSGVASPLWLLAINGVGSLLEGILRDVYLIPHYFTDAESLMHQQHPESTIHIKNGVVRSAFLPQSVLDSMAVGNGFAYPLCENNGAGNLTYDISKPNHAGSTIVNYANSEMRTTADYLDTGIQTALLEQDVSGRVTGLAKTDLLSYSGYGNTVTPIVMSGDMMLNVFSDFRPYHGVFGGAVKVSLLDQSGVIIGAFDVYCDSASVNSKLRLTNGGTIINILDKSVCTLSVTNGVASTYLNDTKTSQSLAGVASASIAVYGSVGTTWSTAWADLALSISSVSLSEIDILSAIAKLMSKYGVT